jgi:hypothetical protein
MKKLSHITNHSSNLLPAFPTGVLPLSPNLIYRSEGDGVIRSDISHGIVSVLESGQSV